MSLVRLQKVLAQAGVASRRKAEELIAAGKVEVNGAIVREQGVRVEPGRDLIRVNGRLLDDRQKKVYFVLYKPPEVVTTLSDPQGRTTVASLLTGVRERVFAVGRLDYDAEGALIITNDGDLANRLMHPRFQVPRVYLAKVKGTPDEATLEQARKGIRLDDGMVRPAEVEAGETAERNTWVKLVLNEGRPHLVKRFFAALGHPVVRLYRPFYGGVSAEGMRPGELRQLTPAEVALLQNGGRAPIPAISAIKAPPRRHRASENSEESASVPEASQSGQPKRPERAAVFTDAMEAALFDGEGRRGSRKKESPSDVPSRRKFTPKHGGSGKRTDDRSEKAAPRAWNVALPHAEKRRTPSKSSSTRPLERTPKGRPPGARRSPGRGRR